MLPPVEFLLHQTTSLLLYQGVLENPVGAAFVELLYALQIRPSPLTAHPSPLTPLKAYGNWFQAIAATQQSWQDFLVQQVLIADNPFTQQAQRSPLDTLAPGLIQAAQHDLHILHQLYECDAAQISEWVQTALSLPKAPIPWQVDQHTFLPEWSTQDWAAALPALSTHYRDHGTGLFAAFRAFRWEQDRLQGIANPDFVNLESLVGYERQRDALVQNTEALLEGYPSLHVLLYGSRGSGKSSLVKALLGTYGDRGLRLVEVTKSELIHLPEIIDRVRSVPQKFIIFVDDLSFEEDEPAYKALKAVLEGNLTARPQNVVVYATSNRRHLIREFYGDRPRPKDADEIHNWDTVQEKLSLSDRFGLTLTFEPADQPTYLQIVHHLAAQVSLPINSADLEFQALQWATRHNGRSGRSARQLIDFLQASVATKR
jgi:uncharacterized protein